MEPMTTEEPTIEPQPVEGADPGDSAELTTEDLGNLIFLSPEYDVSPPEGVSDDGVTEEPDPGAVQPPPAIDPEEVERLRAENEQLQAWRIQQEYARRQSAAEQAIQQWTQIEQQAYQHAQTLDYDSALQFAFQFGRQQAAAFKNIAQQQTAAQKVQAYRQHVQQTYGLSNEDVVDLGANPYEFDARARRMVAQRQQADSRIQQLERQLQQVQRGQQSNRRLATGVDRTGGTGGQGIPVNVDQIPLRDLTRAVMS